MILFLFLPSEIFENIHKRLNLRLLLDELKNTSMKLCQNIYFEKNPEIIWFQVLFRDKKRKNPKKITPLDILEKESLKLLEQLKHYFNSYNILFLFY